MAAPTFITQQQVADALGLSLTSIKRFIKAGRIKAVKIGRLSRIPAEELERFAAELKGEQPAVKKGEVA